MTESRNHFRADHVAAATLLAVMALVSFVNVLGRYLFHYSLAFTEEVTINLFVCMTVVGSGLAFERGGHLGIVSLYNIFPSGLKKVTSVLGAVLSTALFVVVDLLLLANIHQEITLFEATSPALGIPVWIYYALVVCFTPFVFMGIYRGANLQLEKIRREEG